MGDTQTILATLGAGGVIALFFLYIRLKKTLKEEIVDPDINDIRKELNQMKSEFNKELATVKEDGQKMSDKIDRKFDEVNKKLDQNSQAVSQMQGMLTAMFNGLQGNTNYER